MWEEQKYIVKCVICGDKHEVEMYVGFDGAKYKRLSDFVFLRVKTPEGLCVKCSNCIQNTLLEK